jgi:exodeoxyribonuclease-3
MNIISWNVNGLRAVWKRGLFEFMASEAPDLFCVQETKIQHEHLTDDMRRPHGYHSYWSMAEKRGYSGVVTYARSEPLRVAIEFGSPTLDREGRIVHTELPTFHLLNVYFPNSGMGPERLMHKLTFYDEFLRLAEALRRRGKGVVVCGDLNTAHTRSTSLVPRTTSGRRVSSPSSAPGCRSSSATATTTPSGFSTRSLAITRGGIRSAARERGISDGASTTSSSPTSCATA